MTRIIAAVLGVLGFCGVVHGAATEHLGSDSSAVAQSDWPKGIVELARHPSRVYSMWCNGGEGFYFKATPAEIGELLNLFSVARMRDHEVWITSDKKTATSFRGNTIDYNVSLSVFSGIALSAHREESAAETWEPRLTTCVGEDRSLLKRIKLPDNVIVHCEDGNTDIKSKATKPVRREWFGRVQCEDSSAVAEFGRGPFIRIAFWEKGIESCIPIATVDRGGYFGAPFSDEEIAKLETGESWLTITAGNYMTEAKKDDPRFPVAMLLLEREKAQPQKIPSPKCYYGRVLFEDGSPPALDPSSWPGAEIAVEFPYAGYALPDSEGYFKVFLDAEQLKSIAAQTQRKNISVRGDSGPSDTFPVELLSQDKAKAGVVRIPEPAEGPSGLMLVGQEAPALDVVAWLQGEAATIETLRGKAVVLAFWNSQHKSSPELVAFLNRICEKHPNVVVIAVHKAGADRAALAKAIKTDGVKFRVALDKRADDSAGATAVKYGVRPPAVYILDPDGKVAFQDITPAATEEAVAAVLAGK